MKTLIFYFLQGCSQILLLGTVGAGGYFSKCSDSDSRSNSKTWIIDQDAPNVFIDANGEVEIQTILGSGFDTFCDTNKGTNSYNFDNSSTTLLSIFNAESIVFIYSNYEAKPSVSPSA